MRSSSLKLVAGAGAVVLLWASLASASPVCSDPPRELCGGRIFPEAEFAVSFVQHDNGEYEAGIKALAEEYPRFVRVRTFSEVLGKETLSVGGREIWLVDITDFNAPEKDKVAVAVSLSVHGPERAGLEGGVRYMEDLARWASEEQPNHELRNGTEKDSVGMPVSEVLEGVHLYLSNINPDGWAAGDVGGPGVYERGNGNGYDLNRQFTSMGWTQTQGRPLPLTEPEPIAWDKVVRSVDPILSADLHGELTSAQNAFADMMYPADQLNPLEQARQERMARHMASNVTRYFEEQGVEAAQASGVAGMQPAQYATAYDVVGYDDSGFMGDWFTQKIGALDMDVEHFLSHLVPNSTWSAPLEEAHIAAVRGEIESMLVEALVTKSVREILNLGKVGYLFDPKVVTDADGYGGPKPPKKTVPESYRATRMKYFRDLSKFATRDLRKVWSDKLLKGGALKGLDTLVVADRAFPRGSDGTKYSADRVIRAVKAFVKGGGNLVLTDGAIKMLKRLGVVKGRAIVKMKLGAGHINIDDFDDPYLKGVHTTASQTYFEVPIGFSVDSDTSPHWIVRRNAWEKAKGKVLAHVDEDTFVGLGRVKFGKGTIGIFGAVLPQPTEKFDHLYGLADYGVTVAGGQILNNMLAFGR